MAELDFAMLAEFARLDSAGLLTVVGGGFDRIQVNAPGLVHQVFLVMRFRMSDDESSVAFNVQVIPPVEPTFRMAISGLAMISDETTTPLVGNRYAVSVLGLGVPISEPGRYSVQISVSDQIVRTVPFEVGIIPQAAG